MAKYIVTHGGIGERDCPRKDGKKGTEKRLPEVGDVLELDEDQAKTMVNKVQSLTKANAAAARDVDALKVANAETEGQTKRADNAEKALATANARIKKLEAAAKPGLPGAK